MIEAASNMSIPSMAAFLGAILLAAVAPQAGIGAIAGVAAAQQQFQIDFTRANEKEADRIGIELLSKSGFRTESMADFFERLQLASRYSDPKMIPEFLRTHPVTVNRIAEARERADRMNSHVVREDSLDYQLIWQKLNVMEMSDPAQAKQFYEAAMREPNPPNPMVLRYGYVMALTEASDFARARQELAPLLKAQPKLTAFRMAEARIEERAGKLPVALELYRKLHLADPASRAAAYGYVSLLINTGNGDEARRVLRGFGEADSREPRFYKLLAQAEQQLGERANSNYNLAEYYRSVGELELAAEQLRLAQVVPELTHYQRLRIDARLDEIEKDLTRLDRDRAKLKEREERRRRT
jgi:predicted Zn-dependent protease